MSALERAKRAWATEYDGLSAEDVERRVAGFTTMIRVISEDGVVTPERFAKWMGIEPSAAGKALGELSAAGMQTDESGNVIGAALTTRETPHRMRFAGRELYAWCALDALFIPGLLGETADVESTCPSSGDAIRLTVSPHRIEACEPPEPWLSVFLPGGSSRQLGPTSPT